MKQFNLEEYLKNPNRKIITRDNHSARVVCTDQKGGNYPVIALVQKTFGETSFNYTKAGLCILDEENPNDLFFEPEKKEGWINIYKYNSVITPGPQVYDTKEKAESARTSCLIDYISTIKIEWEE